MTNVARMDQPVSHVRLNQHLSHVARMDQSVSHVVRLKQHFSHAVRIDQYMRMDQYD